MDPLSRSHIVTLDDPLPPCWLRVNPTQPDNDTLEKAGIVRAGPTGLLRRKLTQTVDQAREVVLLCSFLLSDMALADALLRAVARGVRVYVLTASKERLSKAEDDETDFGARMIKEHRALLDRLAGKVLLRSSEHFHAKFVVVDPSTRAMGWISTANLNPSLVESVELGVSLPTNSAQALADWFSHAFWMEAEHELLGKGRLAQVRPSPRVPTKPQTGGGLVVTTSDDWLLRDQVLRLLRGARRTLLISCYGWDLDHEALQVILEKARQGVEVTLLTRPRPAVGAAMQAMAAAGATICAHDKLHAKAIISDDSGMVMTANLQAHGLDSGFEVGLRLEGTQVQVLRTILLEWCRDFPWRYDAAARRDQHLGELCLASEGLRTGKRQVIPEAVVKLPPVEANSALDLTDAPEPTFTPPRLTNELPQRLRYEWEVRPPRLPKKARELLQTIKQERPGKDGKPKTVDVSIPYDPPAFELGGRRYIPLGEGISPSSAERLARELGATVVLK